MRVNISISNSLIFIHFLCYNVSMQKKLTEIFLNSDLHSILMKVGGLGISGWKDILLNSDSILKKYKFVLDSSRLVYRKIKSLSCDKDEIKLAIKVVMMPETMLNNRISRNIEAYESLYVNLSCFQNLSGKELDELNDLDQIVSNDLDSLNKTVEHPVAKIVADERILLYEEIKNFQKSLNVMVHGQK